MRSLPAMRRPVALALVAALAALGVLTSAATADAATKRFAGEIVTSPGSEFSFKVVEKRGKRPVVKDVRFSGLTAFCENGSTVPVISEPDGERLATLDRRGRFSRTQAVDRVDFQGLSTIRGRVQGRKGRGLLSFSFRTEDVKCSTGVDRWEADRVGPMR